MMARYGMVIDLNLCFGCNACTVACKAEQEAPAGVFLGKVLEKEVGKYPSAKRLFVPVLCNHCQEAPCADICPTGATYKREDGIVMVNGDKCIGCRACGIACPYDIRFFVEEEKSYFPSGLVEKEREAFKRYLGVSHKCDFCVHRVEKGQVPACVEICPAECRYFGDIDDPTSEVFKLTTKDRASQLLPECDTGPAVFYLR